MGTLQYLAPRCKGYKYHCDAPTVSEGGPAQLSLSSDLWDGGFSVAPSTEKHASPGLVTININDEGISTLRRNGRTDVRIQIIAKYRDVEVRRVLVHAASKVRNDMAGPRGEITEFSVGSRRRMVEAMRNTPGLTHMITLTYPADFPTDGPEVKRHWANMRKRLVWQGVAGVWFLEFQKRGAPHFHIFCNKGVSTMWLSDAWYEIVNSGDSAHQRAGTRVETLLREHGAAAYAAKYAAKSEQKEVPEGFTGVGRFWGRFGAGLEDSERVVAASPHPDAPGAQAAYAALAQVARVTRKLAAVFLARAIEAGARRPSKRPWSDRGTGKVVFYGIGPEIRAYLRGVMGHVGGIMALG